MLRGRPGVPHIKRDKIKIAATFIAQNTTLFGFPKGRRLLLKRIKSRVKEGVIRKSGGGGLDPFAGLPSSRAHFLGSSLSRGDTGRCQQGVQEDTAQSCLAMGRVPQVQQPSRGVLSRGQSWLQVTLEEDPLGGRKVREGCAPWKQVRGRWRSGEEGAGLRHVRAQDRPELVFSH